jgi:hypothetical protein
MTEVCPVSERQINERIARSNAILTFIFTILFVITSAKWLIYILAVDFIIRAFFNGSYSPFGVVSRIIISRIVPEPKLINAGPKIFAARVGSFLTITSIALYLTGFVAGAYLTAGILFFFSFLEGVFGFCVACKIYPFLFRERKIAIE